MNKFIILFGLLFASCNSKNNQPVTISQDSIKTQPIETPKTLNLEFDFVSGIKWDFVVDDKEGRVPDTQIALIIKIGGKDTLLPLVGGYDFWDAAPRGTPVNCNTPMAWEPFPPNVFSLAQCVQGSAFLFLQKENNKSFVVMEGMQDGDTAEDIKAAFPIAKVEIIADTLQLKPLKNPKSIFLEYGTITDYDYAPPRW